MKGKTVVREAQNGRSTSSARERMRSQPAHSIRDSGNAARKVRMYGCNLPYEPSPTESLANRGRPCTDIQFHRAGSLRTGSLNASMGARSIGTTRRVSDFHWHTVPRLCTLVGDRQHPSLHFPDRTSVSRPISSVGRLDQCARRRIITNGEGSWTRGDSRKAPARATQLSERVRNMDSPVSAAPTLHPKVTRGHSLLRMQAPE